MGAMENVGLVTYNDIYITRGEKFTRARIENTYNTVLHEISHMWFGNLVTMKWWDDLWLNESFANMISYMCADKAKGLDDCTLSWSIFLQQQYWGLRTDTMDTSHPIAATCNSTADAEDIFDGISYGKGASWLHQMIFMYGNDVLKEGLKTYFAKYSFKNTELKDFVQELATAAKKVGAVETEAEMIEWTDDWLKTAGCAEIELDHSSAYTCAEGVLTSCKLRQRVFNQKNTPENKLRVQKFVIAVFDEDMNVIKEVTVKTSSEKAVTDVTELIGGPSPYAFAINYRAYGYAKFIIDDVSLNKFERGKLC